MDIGSAGVVGSALLSLGPTVRDLIQRAAGPAADEVGEWLRDKVRDYRRRNAERIVVRASEMIEAVGGEAREVPMRTLLPLLESGSLEDDEQLQQRWAALLANASVGMNVSPVFPRILAQMGVVEARVLDSCGAIDAAARASSEPGQKATGYVSTRRSIAERTGIASVKELEVALDTLEALRLLETEPALYPLDIESHSIADFGVRLTELGRTFLSAVTQPRREAPSPAA